MMGFQGAVGMAAGQEFVLVLSSLLNKYGSMIWWLMCLYILYQR